MKRNEWEFQIDVRRLLRAARAKRALHESRVAWWKGKQKDVMRKVRGKGLSIHEDIAASYANVTKVMRGAQIVVDERLQADLNECHAKLRLHGELAQTYDAWVQVLQHADQRVKYPLHHDDYLFFFGVAK